MATHDTSCGTKLAVWINHQSKEAPPNSVIGGKDTSGEPLYVGRAKHEGDLIPGKVRLSEGCCYVVYEYYEYKYNDYEILTIPEGLEVHWVPAEDGHVPPDAIQGGITSANEPLYIGRADHERDPTIGKIDPSKKCMSLGYSYYEYKKDKYEVLCIKASKSHALPKWQNATIHDLPKNAFVAELDEHGEAVYVGRALHEGYVYPGLVKISPPAGCYVDQDNVELRYDNFEVLTLNEGVDLKWVRASGGEIPVGAIHVGQIAEKEPLYLGRQLNDTIIRFGKLNPDQRPSFVCNRGIEIEIPEYEILCSTYIQA